MLKYIMTFLATALFPLFAVEVTVSGIGTGELAVARETAMADALRNAVRQGAGVNITSESKVENFQLEYDRVFTHSLGYVKKYTVLSQTYDTKNRTYVVRIKAEVDKNMPSTDDFATLKTLQQRMVSPRVMIECNETITGLPASRRPVAETILQELCRIVAIQVVDRSVQQAVKADDARRAQLFDEALDAQAKQQLSAGECDFKIIAEISGELSQLSEPFPGMKVRDAGFEIDLRAVWADTGELIAAETLPVALFKGERMPNLPHQMPRQLVKNYLSMMLKGEGEFKQKNAVTLLRKMLVTWAIQLDLGNNIRFEFRQIPRRELDAIMKKLAAMDGVSQVRLRNFDARLTSAIEVETRNTPVRLTEEIQNLYPDRLQLDTATMRRVCFLFRPQGKTVKK